MKTVGAREANQNFSKLLREVEAGEQIAITRNGEEIARLVPSAPKPTTAEREAARQRLLEFIEIHARPLNIEPWKRSDLYE